jgi:hypothetical protein
MGLLRCYSPAHAPASGHALVMAIAAAAVTGVVSGLAHLGLDIGWGASRAGDHGPLLVLGVFAVVVAQERAAVLGSRWALAAPAGSACAAIAILAGWPAAPWIAVVSNAAMVATNLAILGWRPSRISSQLLAGSALLLSGTAGWASGVPLADVVPAWTSFFVLTITAERARLSRHSAHGVWTWRVLDALTAALVLSVAARLFGVRAAGHALGVAMAGLAIWQMRYDVAGDARTQAAYPRYMAIGVRAGTVWLFVGGILLAFIDPPPGGPVYDAILHAVFVGFVLSTGFAHAINVVPVVSGGHVPFSALFYAPLSLLHATLVVRLAGDVAGLLWVRQVGGVGNALAIALFAAVMASAGVRGRFAPDQPL